MPILNITRTIYDPAIKDFVFDSSESKAMPHIKHWINNKNPVIYWYVLRIDILSDNPLDQWAVELYTHQALHIVDAYVEGIDRRFELKKGERDSWSDKYVLSIPKQLGIPITGRGSRRIFFKVDINCKEGLMHEYSISGTFIAQGAEPINIREKTFRYSCKVGEFRQIFNNNPDEASIYAEKRLSARYSSNDIQLFTNSFRMIHDLYRYCHSGSLEKDELMNKLHLLHANFEKVPEIADEKINPLLNNSIRELDVLIDRDKFKSRYIRLCDSLVELLHIQVMGANPGKGAIAAEENETTFHKTGYMNGDDKISQQDKHIAGSGNKECPVCQNIIDSSNKLLICQECGIRFCHTCESWFRDERQRGEGPICNNCFTAEQERLSREREKKSLKGTAEEAERKRKEERLRKELEEAAKQPAASIKNSIEMEFVLIPSGEFQMGSNEHSAEQPAHKVKISKPFYLGKYPVTQKEWKAVMGSNPSYYKGDNGPVEQVSWNDVQEFVRKLNSKEGNEKYRLPSEAEWEYACRAGTTTKYCFGDNESKLDEYAWYNVNSEGKTHPVGQKKPNLWGLCDMHGNVWEWVQDKWHDSYKFAPTDGSALEGSSSLRVFRGGSWYGNVGFCRSANRGLFSPINCNNGLGFRLLRAV